MKYDLAEHRHRFAVWAAARASQRGFTTVQNLRQALESTNLRHAVESTEILQLRSCSFEELHRRWCSEITRSLVQKRVPRATFGRAAKLVAVYLKATVLMGDAANTPFGRQMHPPIDRTLLQHLAACHWVDSPHKAVWRTTSWTHLNEAEYYSLIEQLRAVAPEGPFWMLEQLWNPPEEEEAV